MKNALKRCNDLCISSINSALLFVHTFLLKTLDGFVIGFSFIINLPVKAYQYVPVRRILVPKEVRVYVLMLSLVSFDAVSANHAIPNYNQQSAQFPSAEAFKYTNLTYKILPSVNNTWGYQIFSDNKVVIKQPNIPGMPGNLGFANKKSAEEVAKLVISKIQRGEMPPSVTIEELKKIKAI